MEQPDSRASSSTASPGPPPSTGGENISVESAGMAEAEELSRVCNEATVGQNDNNIPPLTGGENISEQSAEMAETEELSRMWNEATVRQNDKCHSKQYIAYLTRRELFEAVNAFNLQIRKDCNKMEEVETEPPQEESSSNSSLSDDGSDSDNEPVKVAPISTFVKNTRIIYPNGDINHALQND